MQSAQVQSLSRQLLPHMPGFRQHRWLLYATPMEHLLRGFCFERSGFDTETFYLNVFVMPLYIPTSHVHLSFGDRLRSTKGQAWNITNPRLVPELVDAIRREGLPFLECARQPSDLPGFIQGLPVSSYPPALEAVAYSLVMAGDYSAAQAAFERLTNVLDRGINWQEEMLDRARAFASKLRSDPSKAREQLADWEHLTLANLELPHRQ